MYKQVEKEYFEVKQLVPRLWGIIPPNLDQNGLVVIDCSHVDGGWVDGRRDGRMDERLWWARNALLICLCAKMQEIH